MTEVGRAVDDSGFPIRNGGGMDFDVHVIVLPLATPGDARAVESALNGIEKASSIAGRMTGLKLYKRLRNMRDEAIRRPAYRVIYAHALTVAHMDGHLIADDHPAWEAIYDAIRAARGGDPDALDTLEREIARLHD